MQLRTRITLSAAAVLLTLPLWSNDESALTEFRNGPYFKPTMIGLAAIPVVAGIKLYWNYQARNQFEEDRLRFILMLNRKYNNVLLNTFSQAEPTFLLFGHEPIADKAILQFFAEQAPKDAPKLPYRFLVEQLERDVATFLANGYLEPKVDRRWLTKINALKMFATRLQDSAGYAEEGLLPARNVLAEIAQYENIFEAMTRQGSHLTQSELFSRWLNGFYATHGDPISSDIWLRLPYHNLIKILQQKTYILAESVRFARTLAQAQGEQSKAAMELKAIGDRIHQLKQLCAWASQSAGYKHELADVERQRQVEETRQRQEAEERRKEEKERHEKERLRNERERLDQERSRIHLKQIALLNASINGRTVAIADI